jgi:hypothetical protein
VAILLMFTLSFVIAGFDKAYRLKMCLQKYKVKPSADVPKFDYFAVAKEKNT